MKLDPNRKVGGGARAVMAAVAAGAAVYGGGGGGGRALLRDVVNLFDSLPSRITTGRVFPWGECMPLRMRVHDREPIGSAFAPVSRNSWSAVDLQKELRKTENIMKSRAKLRRTRQITQSKARFAKPRFAYCLDRS